MHNTSEISTSSDVIQLRLRTEKIREAWQDFKIVLAEKEEIAVDVEWNSRIYISKV